MLAGVDFGVGAPGQDFFIAGALAFLDEARAEPPDERVKPEQGLDGHVERGGQIIAAARVALLMREDGLQLGRGEAGGDSIGQEQDGPEDAEYAGFGEGGRGSDYHAGGHIERRGGAERGAEFAPAAGPGGEQGEEAGGPEDGEQRGDPTGRRRMRRERDRRSEGPGGLFDEHREGGGRERFGGVPGEAAAEVHEEGEGKEEFEGGGEPEAVADLRAVTAEGEREEAGKGGEECGLPEVIRDHGCRSF